MILPAGTFNVDEKRKTIPLATKLAVVIRQKACAPDGVPFSADDVGKINFDHRPALEQRPYDTEAGDFIPPQNDPAFIEAIRKGTHGHRTFGRKEGAEKTVTTRGSDIGEAARARRIQRSQRIHNFNMARKQLGEAEAREMYPDAADLLDRRQRIKRPIKSRGFSQSKRSFQTSKRRGN